MKEKTRISINHFQNIAFTVFRANKPSLRKGVFPFFITLLLVFSSCGPIERPAKPSASGRSGELLVIMDKTSWEGYAGEAVREVFNAYPPMLPQAEPMFDIVYIRPDNFGSLYETHRHIFRVNIGSEHERYSIEIRRDVWSQPQKVITVNAPSLAVFEEVMENNTQAFYDLYLATERRRLINAYRRMSNFDARNKVRQLFDVDMHVPEGYLVVYEEENFLYLRKSATREDFDQGILITTLDYTDPEKDFDPDVIWARRDSITRAHVPGALPGSFMTTYPELAPEFREVDFNGRYAIQARGLWRVQGDFMGGPFVNYTMVDENTNRLFILDGWVFAPKYDKRDYLRQVDAALHTINFDFREEKEESEPLAKN